MTVIENLMMVPGNQMGENLIYSLTFQKRLKKKIKRLKKKLWKF